MKKLSCLLLALTLTTGLFSQSFTIEQILSTPFPSDMTAAPTGDRLAWVQNAAGKRNLWIATGPAFEATMLTNYTEDDGQALGNLIFSPDGSHIAYVRGGDPNRQGEIPNPTSDPAGAKQQVFLIAIDGGEPQLIGEGDNPGFAPDGSLLTFLKGGQIWAKDLENDSTAKQLFTIRGGANSLRWSPNSEQLAFVSSRGDHSFVGIYDLATESITYLDPTVNRDGSPAWSPDGSKIAFLRIQNETRRVPFTPRREALPWSIVVHDFARNTTETIWTANEGMGSNFQGVSADNPLFWSADNQIVFPWEKDGWLHLYAVAAAGGEARLLTPGAFEVQYVTMTPDRTAMLYSSNQDDIDRQHIWQVNINAGKPQPLTSGESLEWAPVMTQKGTIGLLASSGTSPAIAAYLDDDRSLQPLAPATMPDDFPMNALVEPEQVIFTAADGMKIHGQLFKPKNTEAGTQHPAVLFFHGGSRRQMYLGFHDRGYYHNAYALNQYLASKGYIVLSVNYRSGIGYGMKFREALNYGANGASEFNDVLGAGLYLKNRADVDGDKIGLWGGSYGGYLTALGLARASDLFAAGVDIHGVHDWNVVIKNFVPSYNPEQQAAIARRAYESSPVAFLEGWRSPVLLIHGDDDRNVPFSETVDIAESLRKRDVHYEQLIFPDEVHGFLLHKNWLAAYRATVDFFDRMLK